jgi:signal transduction histidine kinase
MKAIGSPLARSWTLQWSTSRTAVVVAIVAALAALGWQAGASALTAVGVPFPSLLIDPFGSYSAVYWPSWEPLAGLTAPAVPRFPDRLIAVDGVSVRSPSRPSLTAQEILDRIAAADAAGHRDVMLTFQRLDGDQYRLHRTIRHVAAEEVIFFFGLYAAVAIFVLWSAIMVLVLARRRRSAIAYCFWSLGAALFLTTFFDYHTTRRLTPLFSLSVVWILAGYGALAWYFPEAPAISLSFARVLLAVALALVAGWTSLGPLLGVDPLGARVFSSYAAQASGLVLLVALLAKLYWGDAAQRRELRSALWGIAAVPAVAAIGFSIPSAAGSALVHLGAPFLVPLIPLSIGYALVRHNIFETREVLTRRMLVVPVGIAALLGATSVWLAWHWVVGAVGQQRAVPLGWAMMSFVLLFLAGHGVATRLFFSAAAKFRPTVEQLTDALASRGDAESIRQAIESAVRRWLPTPSVQLLDLDAATRIEELPPDPAPRLASGDLLWTGEGAWNSRLLVPVRSLGQLRGVIVVSPKQDRAMFTSEDTALLQTIASLGAVALHNAEVVEHLESLRKLQIGVSRDEKLRALGAVGAELAHEIMGPLGFFRFLLDRAGGGQGVDAQDIETGRAEVERLDRMLGNLRRFHTPPQQLQLVPLAGTAQRALRLLGPERFSDEGVRARVAIAPAVTVRCDPDALLQVLYNLLKNAVEAVGETGAVAINWVAQDDHANRLEVWDSGPGVPPSLEKQMFNPWVTSKPTGTGLGLVISHRIVRSFGWSLTYRRENERTCFAIGVPSERPDEI